MFHDGSKTARNGTLLTLCAVKGAPLDTRDVGTVTVESFGPAELRWRQAMAAALYGPRGFYTNAAPKDHFRTSSLASDLFAAALLRLVMYTDESLGGPTRSTW